MTSVASGQAPSASRPTETRQPVLEARGIVKTFGRVVGLDGVNLKLYPGEVLAVIGDNGAGKSTLIKCLTGAYTADSGEIWLDGHRVDFKRPQDAREVGIAQLGVREASLAAGVAPPQILAALGRPVVA